MLFARYVLRQSTPSPQKTTMGSAGASPVFEDDKKEKDPEAVLSVPAPEQPFLDDPAEVEPDVQLVRRMSRLSALSAHAQAMPELSPSAAVPDLLHDSGSETAAPSFVSHASRTRIPTIARSLRPLKAIVTPVTVAIAISLPIALIQDLKALFVDVSSEGGPNWKGPDGKPPLSFIIDTGAPRVFAAAYTCLLCIPSVVCRQYRRTTCAHHAWRVVRPSAGSAAAVAAADYRHACGDTCQDGHYPCVRHLYGPGDDERRPHRPLREGREICGDVS